MEAQGGYDQDRFISTVPRRLVCGICCQVVREPQLCEDEKHSFCFSCISQHLNESQTCPECRKRLTPETLVHPQSYLQETLGELVIKCDYIERGCPDHIQLGNLKDHVNHCGFAPVTCEKCGMQINRKDKDNHEKSVCQLGDIKANQDQMKEELCSLRSKLAEIDEMKESLDVIKLNHNIVPARLNEIMNDHEEYLRSISENQHELKRRHDQMDKNLKSINKSLKESKRKRNQVEIVSTGAARESDQESYDVSRFVGKVKEDLLCIICKEVPKDPRLCKNKDHVFCLAHVSRHLQNSQTCPYCRAPLTLETLRRPTGFLKNCLDDLKIKCDHHDRGCTGVFGLENLPEHVKQCQFAPVMCGIEGCEMIVNKSEKENHEKNLCPSRNVKYYDYRQIKLSQDKIKESLDEMKANQDEWKNDVRDMKQQFERFAEKFNQVADQPLFKLSSSNKEIIIMGGVYRKTDKKSVSIFNLANGTYAELPPMNSPRSSASSCVYNNDVIVAGGCHGQDGLDNIEILKINQYLPRWTTSRGKLPFKVSSHILIVYQDTLLVIGGFNWETDEISNEIHELALDKPYTPTLMTTMPQPRQGLTAEIVNDKLFILGGVTTSNDNDDNDNVLDSVVMYDFIAKEFTTFPSLPNPVYNMATVTWGNKIIVIGGRVKNRCVLNDVIMYDTESGLIEKLPSLKHNRADHSAVICDDVIVVIGGWNNQQGYLNSVEYWKIGSDDSWKELPGMTENRRELTAVVIP